MNSGQRILLRLIDGYQKTLSPDHSPRRVLYPAGYCRFTPTCSQYGYQAVERYGVIKGSWLAFRRILRCTPWSRGGADPLK